MAYKLDSAAPYRNLINNELFTTPHTVHGVNPSTEQALPDVPQSSQDEVDRAVAAGQAAFPLWRSQSWAQRAACLEKLADAIEAHYDTLRDLDATETGKPLATADIEMALTLQHLRETAKLRLPDEVVKDTPAQTAVVKYRALGVTAAIVPWNWPVLLGLGKLGPGVLAGNVVIMKPSPYAPYTLLRIGELAAQIFPPGVVAFLSGDESLGPRLTHHPDIAKISFTGSTATGRKVGEVCGRLLKRVTLELGGNDAAVVCEDADIAKTVPAVVSLALIGSGQICMNIKRIYVHESIYDEFLAAAVAFIKNMPYGSALDKSTAVGPVQNAMQYGKVRRFFEEAEKREWTVAVGGLDALKDEHRPSSDQKTSGSGLFLPPTLIDNPPESASIVAEEPFGPILPILRWSDEADVVKRANAFDWALGASVWGADLERATRIADQLEAGSVWINGHFQTAPDMPFGGHKASGIGMDWGIVGLKGWCNAQGFWTNKI